MFMQDMNQLHDVTAAMQNNQYDGQMGKDPNVTKANGGAYNGEPPNASQARFQALMTNKEILKLQTQALSQLPSYTLDKILDMQDQINYEIEALLQKETQKSADLSKINQRELRNFNHVYQKHRQAQQNAKGQNTSKKETREFYHNNQRYHKNGNYLKHEGLAQLGGALRRSFDNSPSVNIAKATMEVLKTNNRMSQDFFQLYDLLPVEDGVMYNRSTRSLSHHRRMSAVPLASKSQAVLGAATTPSRPRSRGAYEQIFDSHYPTLGRTTYTGYWRSQEKVPHDIKDRREIKRKEHQSHNLHRTFLT